MPGQPFNNKSNLIEEADRQAYIKWIDEVKNVIDNDVNSFFGKPLICKLKRYVIPCSIGNCKSEPSNFIRHLKNMHKYSEHQVHALNCINIRMWTYLTGIVKSRRPYVCSICQKMFTSIARPPVENKGDGESTGHGLKPINPELGGDKKKCRQQTQKYFDLVPSMRQKEVTEKVTTPNETTPVDFAMPDVLRSAQTLGVVRIKRYNLCQENFKMYYDDADTLEDFGVWQFRMCHVSFQQSKTNKKYIKEIWECVDPAKNMIPHNELSDSSKIHLQYILPRVEALQEWNRLSKSRKEVLKENNKEPLSASALRNRTTVFLRFLDFLLSWKVFAGFKAVDIASCQSCINQEINRQLRTLQCYRSTEVREQKQTNLITAEESIKYGKSQHIQSLKNVLFSLNNDKTIKVMQAIHIRNFIMYMLSIGNWLRSSNLIFLTNQEYMDSKLDNEIVDCYAMSSKKYKTSFLYGTKYILMDPDMHLFLGLYIEHLRPRVMKLVDDGKNNDERFVFTSSREDRQATVMSTSAITGEVQPEKKHMTQSNVAQAISGALRLSTPFFRQYL